MNTFSRNPNNTHDPPKVSQALRPTPQCTTTQREGTPSVSRGGSVVTSGPCPRRMGHRRSRSVRAISLVTTSTTPFPHKSSTLRSRLPVVGENDMWSRPPSFSFKARVNERESASSLSGVQVCMRPRVCGECSMNATYRFPDLAGHSSWVCPPVGY